MQRTAARHAAGQLAGLAASLKQALLQSPGPKNSETDVLGAARAQLAGALSVPSRWSRREVAEATAQLVAYGLFAARCHLPAERFQWPDCVGSLPSPLLRGLLGSLLEAPATSPWCSILEQIGRSLQAIDTPAILKELSEQTSSSNPAIYFYEQLLFQYDARLRRARGVYFTPQPIAAYLARSIHLILRKQFGFARGLGDIASPGARITVIDPACGHGIFLLEVLRLIRTAAACNGREIVAETGQPYPTLWGFDIQPACCAAAHEEMSLLAAPPACPSRTAPSPRNASEARLPRFAVHLGNPLEQRSRPNRLLQELVDRGGVPVILGNPPYSNFGRLNRGAWISRLLGTYKEGLSERKLNLHDDFIKFLRWGQYWIERAGAGMLAYVTSRTYLDGLTHSAMRRSLTNAFSEIYLLDLHGDQRRQKPFVGLEADENVFGVRQGVALGIFIKHRQPVHPASVFYAELRGSRESKFQYLARADVQSTSWTRLRLSSAPYLFVPRYQRPVDEYRRSPRVDEVFACYTSGVQTKNDALWTDMRRGELQRRTRDRLPEAADYSARCVQPYMMAPFDRRWVYYDPRLLGRPRYPVMQHMIQPNLALVFMRQSTNRGVYDHFLAVDSLVSDRVFYSAHGAPFLAPLYVYQNTTRQTNLDPAFVDDLAQRLKGPRPHAHSIFHYLYAIFHAPTFRQRYAGELREDFPRVPLTSDLCLFQRLCRLGKRLVQLHLLSFAVAERRLPAFEGRSDFTVGAGFPQYVEREQRIDINRQQVLRGVPRAAWEFHIGGYPVLRRWFKQRRNRRLRKADREYIRKVVFVLTQTRATMARIDAAIGRWPLR